MNKKIIEYIIVAIAIILLIYASYFFISYQYYENEITFDSITLLAPMSSQYEVVGDTIEFRNPTYSFYNLDVVKTNSDDVKVKSLLNALLNFNTGGVTYYNESCYLIFVEYEVGDYKNHAMIIPVDSFNQDDLTFSKNTTVWLFESNNNKFVIDSALNSKVVL